MNENLAKDSQAVSVLIGLEELYPKDQFFVDLRESIQKFPRASWDRALSRGQISSKLWLIDKLNEYLANKVHTRILICGGWYGVLSRLLFLRLPSSMLTIRSFDLDAQCELIAETLNRPWVIDEWKFKAFTADMLKLNYDRLTFDVRRANGSVVTLCEDPDIIINTCCEHLFEFDRWYEGLPEDKLIILQSTNLVDDEHVNPIDSLEEFKATAPMNFLFAGELNVNSGAYQRYMLIGTK